MGQCYGKTGGNEQQHKSTEENSYNGYSTTTGGNNSPHFSSKSSFSNSPFPPASPMPYASSPANSTPRRMFRRPFPPPSPAKHIQASLMKRLGTTKTKEAGGGAGGGGAAAATAIENGGGLDKSFGFAKNFASRYELGQEIGRGHFGHTCFAKVKRGELKGQQVAVKIIMKAKMTTAIAIEDVRREVKILKALSGHPNLVKFYDACEDNLNVYIVMELCEGGELLDRILSRGGKFPEEDAKVVLSQILQIVAYCHLQGVVHRDLKPENFLFTAKDENAPLKAIDFGLSDYVKPDEKLNDIVGSAYYVAPEVLHRSYSMEADIWSVGVITYILFCGSRPFWARTESGIFRAVLRADPNFVETPWPSVSTEAKDFVKRLLNKDSRKRMTAVQALSHPWIRGERKIPLDIFIFKQVKAYLRATPLKQTALKALSRTLTEDELIYLRAQFLLLEPSKNGRVSLENFRMALAKHSTDAMKEARLFEMLSSMDALASRKMDFYEFCAATISVYQLEALDRWERHARSAYEIFNREGNRSLTVEELAKELGLSPNSPAHVSLHEWLRPVDGKLSFYGFTKLLHGVSPRLSSRPR
ncbi:CPK-related protein kinase 3 [Selaginella moellendorffii]|uniref:CPK-related protein kinase 3 n=1 Tax=Selaginella moellendorffii TaxID=88036 RepID=D8SKH8_SELML|nr:CDPK-related kinase 5 [Selaginella moellendorffii]EFJ14849.1 CPK-related protein kinase 3 [Selaginella moellendorffii]|eukprot:XP_002983837.1 CDPK-related kinase 5 [Selaginella moellendorffii]